MVAPSKVRKTSDPHPEWVMECVGRGYSGVRGKSTLTA
jgi:hypothetical protein